MQQSDPTAAFFWHDIPTQVDAKQSKAKTHAAKQSYFSFCMADLTQVDGKQSKTQTNAAKES
jgi:hypothetical protein